MMIDLETTMTDVAKRRRGALARLATLAVRTFLLGEHEQISEALTERKDWANAEAAWSGAIMLAKYLKAGRGLAVPKSTRIGGQLLTRISSAQLEALAQPSEGDTPIPTLVKYLMALLKELRVSADRVQEVEELRLAAFLLSPGGGKYRGEAVSPLRSLLLTEPASYMDAIEVGDAVLLSALR